MEVVVLGAALGVFGLVLVAAVGFAGRERAADRSVRDRAWATWAARHGLAIERGRIVGTLDGWELRIERRFDPSSDGVLRGTGIRVWLPTPVLGGLRLSPERGAFAGVIASGDLPIADEQLDPMLDVRAAEPRVARQTLMDADVRASLRAVVGAAGEVWVEGRRVETAWSGQLTGELERAVRRTIAIAEAVQQAPQRRWRASADARGWTLSSVPGGMDLDGAASGLDVRVRFREDGPPRGPQGDRQRAVRGGKSRTRVEVDVPALAPSRLRVELREASPRAGIELADPILARLVRVEAADPARAAALLRDDELRASLLEVVHGHPGSEVGDGQVTLRVAGLAGDDLDTLIDRAAELARRLEQRAVALSAGAGLP